MIRQWISTQGLTPTIGMVVLACVAAFFAMTTYRVFRKSARAHWERAALLPFND